MTFRMQFDHVKFSVLFCWKMKWIVSKHKGLSARLLKEIVNSKSLRCRFHQWHVPELLENGSLLGRHRPQTGELKNFWPWESETVKSVSVWLRDQHWYWSSRRRACIKICRDWNLLHIQDTTEKRANMEDYLLKINRCTCTVIRAISLQIRDRVAFINAWKSNQSIFSHATKQLY